MNADFRRWKVREALAAVLADLVDEYRNAGPGEDARLLHTIGLVTGTGRQLGAALDGIAMPEQRPANPAGDEVESVAGQGIYGGLLGGLSQGTENHGQRVITELISLGRAYIARQNQPGLGELMAPAPEIGCRFCLASRNEGHHPGCGAFPSETAG